MRNKKILIPSILVAMLLIFAFFSPYLTPYNVSKQNLMISRQPPSPAHIMGTDIYGRDMFSRVIAASRISIFYFLINPIRAFPTVGTSWVSHNHCEIIRFDTF